MVTATEIETRLRDAVDALPKGLRNHILRVEEYADNLASRHRVDGQRSRVAALGHDLVRHIPGPELLAMAARYGIEAHPVEVASPVLIHGPVAAKILSRDYGLDDQDIINGVDCHTTARTGMAPVEKVLFIADKVEPSKLAKWDALQSVADLGNEDLDAGILRYLDLMLEEAVRLRRQVHPRLTEARNALVVLKGENTKADWTVSPKA